MRAHGSALTLNLCVCMRMRVLLMAQEKAMRAGEPGCPQEVSFASPEWDSQDWEFLLFQPSPQHTAALCLQRSELHPKSAETEDDISTRSADDRNRSLCEDIEGSCDSDDSVNGSQRPQMHAEKDSST